MKTIKSIITAIAIAFIAMHFTTAPALAAVVCEGVKPTPLHKAIDAGDYEEARKQIKREYVNVIAQYKDGDDINCYTPSQLAAARDDVSREFIDALIKAEADFEANNWELTSKDGAWGSKVWRYVTRPIRKKLSEATATRVEEKIAMSASPEAVADPANLFDAVKAGDAVRLKSLLEAGADAQMRDSDGNTPLHFAAAANSIEAIETLLATGAEVNAKDNEGWAPLHWAAYDGRLENVQAILKAGAGVNAKERDGWTPLHLVAQGPVNEDQTDRPIYIYAEIAQALIIADAMVDEKNNDGWTPLHLASANGHTEVAQALLDAGAKVDAKERDGWTPLHLVAQGPVNEDQKDRPIHIYAEIAQALIIADAMVDEKNNDGSTPLHIATVNGHTEVARTLITARAKLDAIDNDGWSPLHLAALSGNTEITQALITARAQLDAIDNDGWSPLHLAAFNGNTETTQALIAARANLDAIDNDGRSPLHLAAFRGNTNTAQALINAGANMNVEDNLGLTALDIAESEGKTETANTIRAAVQAAAVDLFDAAKEGNTARLKSLLKAGTNVDSKDNDGGTPLHWAANFGHTETILALIDAGANVNVEDNNGSTPLHWAANFGHTETALALINAGADVYAKNKWRSTPLNNAVDNGQIKTVNALIIAGGVDYDGDTPLHNAAYYRRPETAQVLIDSGADVNAKNDSGSTPLHAASGIIGDTEIATKIAFALIAAKANVQEKDDRGNTPLHIAADLGRTEIAQALIAAGAKVDAKEEDDWTPLHFAASRGYTQIAQALIANGADVNVKNNDGLTALDIAESEGNTETANAIRAAAQATTADSANLFDSVKAGDAARLKSLLRAGADVNVKDNEGWTPLHWAAFQGQRKTTQMLLDAGAKVDARENDGWTPLHYAAQGPYGSSEKRPIEGFRDVALDLIVAGAEVNAKNNDGQTPLFIAEREGNDETANVLRAVISKGLSNLLFDVAKAGDAARLKSLLKAGADVNVKGEDGLNPLHLAAQYGYTEIATALIAAGADVNAKLLESGWTPLHLVALNGYPEIVQALISNGADVNSRNNNGWTPLHLAAQGPLSDFHNRDRPIHVYTEIAQSLIDAGAEVNTDNNNGASPLSVAVNNGHMEIAQVLIAAGANVIVRGNGGKPNEWITILDANVDGLNIHHFRYQGNHCLIGHLDEVHLNGKINANSTLAVQKLIPKLQDCLTYDGVLKRPIVYLESGGGLMNDGYAMGRLFAQNKIGTGISDGKYCASSCAIAFLGGHYRVMGENSEIMLHSPYDKTTDGVDCSDRSFVAGLHDYYNDVLGKENGAIILERTLSYCSDSDGWTLDKGGAELFGLLKNPDDAE